MEIVTVCLLVLLALSVFGLIMSLTEAFYYKQYYKKYRAIAKEVEELKNDIMIRLAEETIKRQAAEDKLNRIGLVLHHNIGQGHGGPANIYHNLASQNAGKGEIK